MPTAAQFPAVQYQDPYGQQQYRLPAFGDMVLQYTQASTLPRQATRDNQRSVYTQSTFPPDPQLPQYEVQSDGGVDNSWLDRMINESVETSLQQSAAETKQFVDRMMKQATETATAVCQKDEAEATQMIDRIAKEAAQAELQRNAAEAGPRMQRAIESVVLQQDRTEVSHDPNFDTPLPTGGAVQQSSDDAISHDMGNGEVGVEDGVNTRRSKKKRPVAADFFGPGFFEFA